jgi:glycine/D-amino acid oxidase-like deaminating enzyme
MTAEWAERADAVVVGAGFFGCHIALHLRRRGLRRVVLLDEAGGILRRASFVNQARVHNGYHYPRSLATAARSRANYACFCADHGFAIASGFSKLYAIARTSRVSSTQFMAFCAKIGAPCRDSPRHLRWLFDSDLIDSAFLTDEVVFDAVALATDLYSRLAAANIELRVNTRARLHSANDHGATVATPDGLLAADYVFNCTYAGLDTFGPKLRNAVKKELSEIALIEPASSFADIAVTVMDGPFFSTMPFPSMSRHSLSHVRYTPHAAWDDQRAPPPTKSRGEFMLRAAARYMPPLSRARHVGSLYEIKVVLLRNEQDDARPILFESSPESPRVISVLGGKIDNIYDVFEVLQGHDWS